ncbi:MAG: GH25 family lysozyme [Pseudomonadota bacterium]
MRKAHFSSSHVHAHTPLSGLSRPRGRTAFAAGILAAAALAAVQLAGQIDLAPQGEPSAKAPAGRSAPPLSPEVESRTPGIDVSHYQGAVDWRAVAQSGVRFAIIKATEGVAYTDPEFAANRDGAHAAGLVTGAYHFFEPADPGVSQADHFLAVSGIAAGDLPPILDLEHKPVGGDAALRAEAIAWLDHVASRTACTPMVYADVSFYDTYLGSEFERYPLYLADYAAEPNLPEGVSTYAIWQHSASGQVSGIAGKVDLDSFAGSEASLEALLCG